MLEEDFEEERFFVAVRQRLLAGARGIAARATVCETLIRKLEF